MKKKDVLVLFKTHLDIGFTDFSKNIVDKLFFCDKIILKKFYGGIYHGL